MRNDWCRDNSRSALTLPKEGAQYADHPGIMERKGFFGCCRSKQFKSNVPDEPNYTPKINVEVGAVESPLNTKVN